MEAKKNNVNAEELYQEKWLDNYFGLKRSSQKSRMSKKSSNRFEELADSSKGINIMDP